MGDKELTRQMSIHRCHVVARALSLVYPRAHLMNEQIDHIWKICRFSTARVPLLIRACVPRSLSLQSRGLCAARNDRLLLSSRRQPARPTFCRSGSASRAWPTKTREATERDRSRFLPASCERQRLLTSR